MEDTLDNQAVLDIHRPNFDLYARILRVADRDVRRATGFLGLPRKTERANDWHRAIRNNWWYICNSDKRGDFFELVEEPEGQGLDFVVCRTNPDHPMAVRWAHYQNGKVNRNRTKRQQIAQGQYVLFGGLDKRVSGLPTVTIGYALDDDFTQARQPCWWLSRGVLLREHYDAPELLAEIGQFAKPSQERIAPKTPQAVLRSREVDQKQWDELLREINRPRAG